MPYDWISPPRPDAPARLVLWPHQSLQPAGFAGFIGATFALLLVPLLAVLGSAALWGLLPFVLLALAGVWLALRRSQRDRGLREELTLDGTEARLVREEAGGRRREWACNRYWTTAHLHPQGGPVPQYVTLRGCGREVEIGAFLTEEERQALYDDLSVALRR